MADITLSTSGTTWVIGWYGTCADETPYQLSAIKEKLNNVFLINSFSTGLSTWVPDPSSWAPNPFEQLDGGYAYLMIFKPASTAETVSIPGLTRTTHPGMSTGWPPSPLPFGDGNGSVVTACGDPSANPVATTINLSTSGTTWVIGWYGTCAEEEPYQLSAIKEKLNNVFLINSFSTGLSTWVPDPSSWAPNPFEQLDGGYAYLMIFKPASAGSSEVDIPGFITTTHPGMSTGWPPSPLPFGDGSGIIAQDCAPVVPEEQLWISFTGNEHYSDWYELEVDEEEDFTKFKVATADYGTSLQSWATNKTTNLQGILMTASVEKPGGTSLTVEQQTKSYNSDLLSFGCDGEFNSNHGVNSQQINMRVKAYNNQDATSVKKYGSDDSSHGYLASGKPWEGANMVYRTTTFNSLVVDNSGKNSIDIDYIYFIKEKDENAKIKFSSVSPPNTSCGVWGG